MRIACWGATAILTIFSASAMAQGAQKISFSGDMVLGNTPRMGPPPPCILTNRFVRGDQVVFRMRLTDPATGQNLDASAVESVRVEVSNGQSLPMKFGPHPPRNSTDNFWTAAWIIPKDHPTGSLSYRVFAVAKGGAAMSWEPFKVAASQLTVVAE
ncbi:MAG: hypothetical protein ACK4MV_03195 [Beijerinckiaceae bacterium]